MSTKQGSANLPLADKDALRLKVRALTPIWTGDIDRNSRVCRETGLLGSMRCWYEGLVRKHGLRACVPAPGEGCTGARPCEACRLFGTTDRARRFRMDVSGLEPTRIFFRLSEEVRPVSGRWLWTIFEGKEEGNTRDAPTPGATFKFKVQALWSPNPFSITFRTRAREGDMVLPKVAYLLRTMSRDGGIGAKTQHGFGQFAVIEARYGDEVPADWSALCEQGEKALGAASDGGRKGDGRDADLFTLDSKRFFSLKFRLSGHPYEAAEDAGEPPPEYDHSYIPCSFDIRYKYDATPGASRGLRPALCERYDPDEIDALCGYVRRGWPARGSRIHVSHLFRPSPTRPYFVKIWGDAENAAEVAAVISEHIRGRFHGAEEVEEVA
jgi:CRISPR-associated protein Cmr1